MSFKRIYVKGVVTLLCVFFFFLSSSRDVDAGIVPPRYGGRLPDSYLKLRKSRKGAFRLKYGWIRRSQRLKHLRGRRFSQPGIQDERFGSSVSLSLEGTLYVPMIAAYYTDTPGPPFAISELQQGLFSGPSQGGTVSDYYREVSYSKLDVSGSVFGWVALSREEGFYTGGMYQGVQPGVSRTDTMIKECLDSVDPQVDFGLFDNDGPDGIPNSGDDDGFVDVLVIAHSTEGAECGWGSFHMWSHSWNYSSWPGSGGEPYTTDDPSANGGFIRVDDYMIIPSLSCESGMIEIGVLCHELGHTLGLPDLYDDNGGFGIGYWGLMGIGNWNTPSSPAHMCAWSKEQLGWIEPLLVDWRKTKVELGPVEEGPAAVEIPLPTRRFRRMKYDGFTSGYAMVCGYTQDEAEVRGMQGGAGYGNEWHESISRDFTFDGNKPVNLSYDLSYDMEQDYDWACLIIEVRETGVEDTVAFYTGRGRVGENLTLDPVLPSFETKYTLTFIFHSDYNISDEDGGYDSEPGMALNVDNVSLEGGGVYYSCDFEEDSGGWRYSSPPPEYFIVENRRRRGFDLHLPGEGLLIWHAENSIAYSGLGNTGGYTNAQARGLVLEEADGRYNLLLPKELGGNRGDSGDPYPGGTNNRLFSSGTVPSSQSNSGYPTPVVISNISYSPGTSSAFFKGGYPPPVITGVNPDTVNVEVEPDVRIEISGNNILWGAGASLVNGSDTINAVYTEWLGEERIVSRFDLSGCYAGDWGVYVESGDGQTSFLEDAVTIVSIYKAYSVRIGINYISLAWELEDTDGVVGCIVYRALYGEPFEVLSDTLGDAGGWYEYGDSTVVPGREYSYEIEAVLEGGDSRWLVMRGPYSIEPSPFVVFQNYPNPFSLSTRFRFFVPTRMSVGIKVYDIRGALVADLGKRLYGRGIQEREWVPEGLVSGVYLAVFDSSRGRSVRKIVCVR